MKLRTLFFPMRWQYILGATLVLACAPATAQLLGTAGQFAVLGATPSVTNVGPTVVVGSVGIFPAAAVTGFPPGAIVPGTGTLHLADAVAQQAQSDTTTAYNTLAGLPGAAIAPALGGQTLPPGVYNAGAANLTGTLTLNGPGLYVFQTTALTTAAGPGAAAIVLTNGATACDVWWQVGSSAALGTFTAFQGNMIALTSITLGTSATVQGRVLARNGSVTLDSNTINACAGGSTPGFGIPAFFSAGTGVAPTLSEWSMVLMALLLAFTGYVALRNTRS
jgi:hypothetical protein